MKKAAVLFSGGLDSTFVCYKLLKMGYEVHPITFRKDAPEHMSCEPVTIKDINIAINAMSMLDSIRITSKQESGILRDIYWEHYYPRIDKDGHTEHFRNLQFIASAASVCQAKQINELYIGEYDNGPAGHMDASSAFLGHMREVLTMNPFKVKLRTLKTLRINAKWHLLEQLHKDNIICEFLSAVRWCYKRNDFEMDYLYLGNNKKAVAYGCSLNLCKSCQVMHRQINIFLDGLIKNK